MPVNPSEVKFFELLEKRSSENPAKPLAGQTIAEFRQGLDIFLEFAGKPGNANFLDQTVLARDGHSIGIRIYNFDLPEPTPVLIMFPGCGYVCDLFESNAIACSRIAEYSGVRVVIVNIRLAPEYSLPTGIFDAYDVTKHIATHAKEFQINSDRIFIGGLSSGGHATAVVANLARMDDAFTLYHQIHLNGLYDLTGSNRDYSDFEKEDKIFSREAFPFLINHFGIKPDQCTNPLFSPYYESDLTHLPPATFIIGEYDGARSDSENYYKKMKGAGNRVEKILLSGQTHNTMLMRGMMSDGEDPAYTFAQTIKRQLN